jgi:hypothetical protein
MDQIPPGTTITRAEPHGEDSPTPQRKLYRQTLI